MTNEEWKNLQAYINKCFNILSKHKDNLDTKRAGELYCHIGSLVASELDNIANAETLIKEELSLRVEEKLFYTQSLKCIRETLQNYQTLSKEYIDLEEEYPYAFSSKEDLNKCIQDLNTDSWKRFRSAILCISHALVTIGILNLTGSCQIQPGKASLVFTVSVLLIAAFGILNPSSIVNFKEIKNIGAYDEYVSSNKEERQLSLQKAKQTKVRK